MVGISNITNFATRARENVLDGAIEEIGVKIAEKTGLADAASDVIAKPVNALKGLFAKKSAPAPATKMEKAIKLIQKPSFIGGAALGLVGLYAVGRMVETPEPSNSDNSAKPEGSAKKVSHVKAKAPEEKAESPKAKPAEADPVATVKPLEDETVETNTAKIANAIKTELAAKKNKAAEGDTKSEIATDVKGEGANTEAPKTKKPKKPSEQAVTAESAEV